MNDLRFAFRTLCKNPGFASTAILSIGLTVGAGATLFAFYDGLLFRPLPVPNPSQLLTLSSLSPSGTFGSVSFADFADFRRLNHSFNGLIASEIASFGFAKDKNDLPRRKTGLLASGNIFDDLNIPLALGRTFRPAEDQVPGRDAVAVLNYKFWRDEFAADPNIAGRHVLLNGIDFTIIGVASQSFTGLDQFYHPDVFVPAMMAPALTRTDADLLTNRASRAFIVKGRIKPGVTQQAASGEARALAAALAKAFPKTNKGFSAAVRTEMQTRFDVQTYDFMLAAFLFSLVSVVLLIACANIANLLLSRGRARSRELAVRVAIGASRARLIRTLLTECALVAGGGCLLSLFVAYAGIGFVSTVTIPSDTPIDLNVQLDERVLFLTLAVSLSSALLFGLLPAFSMTRGDLVPALKAGELDPTRRRFLGRNALVVAQVAGSLVLMVLTTQLFRGVTFVLARNPGFETRNRLLVGFNPAMIGYTPDQTAAFYKDLLERVRAIPGVKSAALGHFIPTSLEFQQETVDPEGYHFPVGQQGVTIGASTVDENYFPAIGTSILQGRAFLPGDDAKAPPVVVVNQFFAEHYGLKDPIGKRLLVGEKNPVWAQIVGVAANSKYSSIFEPPQDFVYLPLKQHPDSHLTLVVQTQGAPSGLADPVRQAVHAISPNLPILTVRTFDDLYDQRSVKAANIILTIVAYLGAIGLGLALVGLYAVVAFQVSRRTREIGIRMAIGASKSEVIKMVLRQAAVLGLTGVVIGLVLSIAADRAISSLQIPHFDTLLFAAVVVSLLIVTLAAAVLPARRAALIDPMIAIRQD